MAAYDAESAPAAPPTLPDFLTKQYIDGAWVDSTGSGKIDVLDSNTNKSIGQAPDGTAEDIQKAAAAARAAFDDWAATPLEKRKEYVNKIFMNYLAKKDEVVYWLTKELGCTKWFAENVQFACFLGHFSTALAEVDKVAWAEKTGKAVVVKEPIGVVGAITPWNYPLNQVSLKVAPSLLVGCTVVLKPSEFTPIHLYLFAQAVHEAGLPKGVFNMVCGRGEVCGDAMSRSPLLDIISFTGSTRAGKLISAAAAENLTPVKLELGGKSAAIILDDANVGEVVPKFVGQLMNNTGQSCNALSRMLVPKAMYDEVVNVAKGTMEAWTVGKSDAVSTAPHPSMAMGPLISQIQWDRVQALIKKGEEEGATLVCGGQGKPEGLEDGYFVKPTLFRDVNNKMTIAREEIFGPVLSVIPYETQEEAIKIANDTEYGLNNAVASSNPDRAAQVAMKLRSGMVMFNSSDMEVTAPFGGYKKSGNAREWGKWGLDEFLVTKTYNGEVPDKFLA